MDPTYIQMELRSLISEWGSVFTAVGFILLYVIAFAAVANILLVKRDPRSALGWVVICLGFPAVGVILYLVFGVNRIRTRAREYWQEIDEWDPRLLIPHNDHKLKDAQIFGLENFNSSFSEIQCLSSHLSEMPLVGHCNVEILHNGEQAYPEMIKAIDEAKEKIYLCTYIFETNEYGKKFIEALVRAQKRGVDIKVIIDGVGAKYSYPTAYTLLKEEGISVKKFLPLSLSRRSLHLNLRNHRKILAVDDKIGFTGGMNIGDRHLGLNLENEKRVVDVHFKVEGPVVLQMENVFWHDWFFITGERPDHKERNIYYCKENALCRGFSAGPNEEFERLRLLYNGLFSIAKKKIRIMTPYFIPDSSMITMINAAVLRGIEVEIILPEKNNLFYVDWASKSIIWELLKYGVKIAYQPAPFVHSKLFIMDDFYSLIGSANLDPRSLRLNFEFNLEIFDKKLATDLILHFDNIWKRSKDITLADIDNRPISIKLRDAFFKLLSPYL